jgi:hypothetical protein
MTSILPTLPGSASTSSAVNKQASNLKQAEAATSSTFGNLLRQTEVAIGTRSSTGFQKGATYEAQTITGQTKATWNSAVSATRNFLNIK